jgi:hypothetical protein
MKLQTFEDYLMDRFMEMNPSVLDDDINDSFDHWLSEREVKEMMSWGETYGAQCFLAGKELK